MVTKFCYIAYLEQYILFLREKYLKKEFRKASYLLETKLLIISVFSV